MPKYQKIQEIVEAIGLNPNCEDNEALDELSCAGVLGFDTKETLVISPVHRGEIRANFGDWIIKK